MASRNNSNVESMSGAAAMREIRSLQRSFDLHTRNDEEEFKALRTEQTDGFAAVAREINAIKTRQGEIHEDTRTILQALSLDKAEGKKGKPLALMGQGETLFKLGSAMGGFIILWKMAEAAAGPLWQMLTAVNHVMLK